MKSSTVQLRKSQGKRVIMEKMKIVLTACAAMLDEMEDIG